MTKEIDFVGNWHIDAVASGRRALDLLAEIAIESHGGAGATGFLDVEAAVDRPRMLLILWSVDHGGSAFPFVMTKSSDLGAVLDGWLATCDAADYGPAPTCDGSVSPKAFRFTNDPDALRGYGEARGNWAYVIFAIAPAWAEYHK